MYEPKAANRELSLVLGDLDTVYQVSTYGAVFAGVLDGFVPLKELSKWGDFGIGSITGLHGEIAILDGIIHHFDEYGQTRSIDREDLTPKMLLSFFKTDQIVPLHTAATYEETKSAIEQALPSANIMYAIKIEGLFEVLRTKCYPAQPKPYPKGINTALSKHVRTYHNERGTLVGYLMPDHLGEISGLSYHFHFITEDGKYGGHMIDFTLIDGTAYLDYKHTLRLVLPTDKEYYQADLSDTMNILQQVVDISLQ